MSDMRTSATPAKRERGAALLIVLLLVATLSVIALAVLNSVTQSYRATSLSNMRSQALWYALGAEDFARTNLEEGLKLSEGKVTRSTNGLGVPLFFPIEGGQFRARIDDHSNCFNLNSLDQSDEEKEKPGVTDAAAHFGFVLQALEVNPTTAREITSAIKDWVDVDSFPSSFGAETSYYASQTPAVAAANTLMVSPNELLGIRGMTPELYRKLRPLVCAFPDRKITPLNINTLKPEHAPLLFPIFSGQINIENLHIELQDLQSVEYASVEEFMTRPTFALIAKEQRKEDLLGLEANYFRISGQVLYLDSMTSYEAVFVRSQTNSVSLVRRRLGVDT